MAQLLGELHMGIMNETRIDSWAQAVAAFGGLRRRGYVFRGQADAEWSLQTSLDRIESADRAIDELEILFYFQRRALPLLPQGVDVSAAPVTTWTSLLQHYGGPTRLLDVSRSPYVAAFFALEAATKDAAVFALDAEALQLHAIARLQSQFGLNGDEAIRLARGDQERFLRLVVEKHGNFPFVLPIEPLNFDLRQSSQQALFLVPGTLDRSLDELLEAVPESYNQRAVVLKMVFPPSVRDEALNELVSMNVTHSSLFPGLDGLGRSTRLQAQRRVDRSAMLAALREPAWLSRALAVRREDDAVATPDVSIDEEVSVRDAVRAELEQAERLVTPLSKE